MNIKSFQKYLISKIKDFNLKTFVKDLVSGFISFLETFAGGK